MNTNINPDDAKLSALLRQSRGLPPRPLHFQRNVWRRIEDAEAPAKSATWLDVLAALVLRPRFALVGAAVLVMTGALLGARQGDRMAQMDARAQYMTAVAPPTITK